MTEPPGAPLARPALLAAVRAQLAHGGSALLSGPPGIGRSTLLGRLAAGYEQDPGHRVLHCAPSAADRDSPFLGLIDLLAPVGDETTAALAPHERAVLGAALLRTPPPPGVDPARGRDRLVLHLAVRNTLALLSRGGRTRVLLVVDDLQWLDPATAAVLAFLARRPPGPPPEGPPSAPRPDPRPAPQPALLGAVRLAQRPGRFPHPRDGTPYETMCPGPVRTFAVPAMTPRETARLLARQDGPRLPGPVVARLHQAGGGNPRAVRELARALGERVRAAGGAAPAPHEPLPVPDSLRAPVLARLAPLPAGVVRTLLIASAAARPTVGLLLRAGCPTAPADLDTAVRHGLVAPAGQAGGRASALPPGQWPVRFTDPLIPLVLCAEAGYEARIAVHRALAEAAPASAPAPATAPALAPAATVRAHHLPLTATERSVLARVADGASNREIAAGLVVSVKTVEAALTRAYRKLGARSRVEATRLLMTQRLTP
ncbi:AAA family ATPase [Streptomyces sp. V4-01]|uniref:AAA family ATPase n=1 Tax=Actinacidiphila polyblastidii TaxID=3110430 RepID=A0ABU7PEA5_9ACTN|nr:AAA family ATPase [Streptomyces sp. V4-01]